MISTTAPDFIKCILTNCATYTNGATRGMATQMENSLIPPARGCDSGQQVYSDFVTSASCTPDA